MKVAFVFDTHLLKNGENYYGMTLTYDFFKKRYLDKIDKLVVITRVDEQNTTNSNTSGYKKTNGDNVIVSPVQNYKTMLDGIIKQKAIQDEIKEKLDGIDKAIIRMPSVLGIIAARICRERKIPYFIECVACALDGYLNHTNPMGKIIALPMYYLIKNEIKKSEMVLYVTENFLQKRYPTNGKQYACSDVEIPSKAFKLKSTSKPGHAIRLYTVANVEMKYKGHIYAFRAIKKLNKMNIKARYYLIGNGDQSRLNRAINRLGIKDDIIFLGSMPHDEVLNALTEADIYIQPSLQEGLPRALIEAMSVGCPAIASNAGGCPELLTKKHIFKKRNWRDLVKKIISMNNEKALRSASVENRKKAKAFSEENLNKKRNDIYKEFLDQ